MGRSLTTDLALFPKFGGKKVLPFFNKSEIIRQLPEIVSKFSFFWKIEQCKFGSFVRKLQFNIPFSVYFMQTKVHSVVINP